MSQSIEDIPVKDVSNEDIILGLIGGMKDEMISSFSYKGMVVHRQFSSVAVSPDGNEVKTRGGRFHLESANPTEVKSWLDTKAELYGEA